MNVKKIFDLIFEQVDEEDVKEEVVIDKPLVKHNFKEEKINPKPIVQSELKKKDVLDRPSNKFDINATNVTRKPTSAFQNAKASKKYESKNAKKYVSEPFLSPINGVIGTKNIEIEKPSYVPTNKVKPSKNPLCTVLSPIYGVMGEEVVEEKEIIEKVENKEKVVMPQSNVKPLTDHFDEITTISKKDFTTIKEEKPEIIETVTPISEILSDSNDEETYVFSEDITLFDEILENDK